MTLVERLQSWQARSKISAEQYTALSALVKRQHFSVFFELQALLYLGVLAFIAGLGWTIKVYFAELGDTAVLVGLSGIFVTTLAYCFKKGSPYSPQEVESPNYIFDYVLYLSCLVFSLELSYLETRYHLLNARWDLYLLAASLLFFLLAYRFDNRFVLSLALSTLAAWFGVKITGAQFFRWEPLRPYALAYGGTVCLAGVGLYQAGSKKHFLNTYLHIAAIMLLGAALSGVLQRGSFGWALLLGLFAGVSAVYGSRSRQFGFLAYAVLYGYIGISSLLTRHMIYSMRWGAWFWFYYLISGGVVIVALVKLSRQFEAES